MSPTAAVLSPGAPPSTVATPYLQSGAVAEEDELGQEEGDFFSTGDGRAGLMFFSSNLLLKLNISYSFIPQRKVCTFCPAAIDHPVLGSPRGSNLNSPGREVILLCDQAYPTPPAAKQLRQEVYVDNPG